MSRLLERWVSALQTIGFLVLMLWCCALINHLSGHLFNQFGIYPRQLSELTGVLFWVLLHADFAHLLLNTAPLVVMGFFVALRGPRLFLKITVVVWVVAGIAVWLFGRSAFHIGASGLVFGYFGFLLAVAVVERNITDLTIASFTVFYYGGMIFGVLPVDAFVSWESHLFGLASGVLAARLFGRDWVLAQEA